LIIWFFDRKQKIPLWKQLCGSARWGHYRHKNHSQKTFFNNFEYTVDLNQCWIHVKTNWIFLHLKITLNDFCHCFGKTQILHLLWIQTFFEHWFFTVNSCKSEQRRPNWQTFEKRFCTVIVTHFLITLNLTSDSYDPKKYSKEYCALKWKCLLWMNSVMEMSENKILKLKKFAMEDYDTF